MCAFVCVCACVFPLTCDVVHHHGSSRVSDVAGDEAPETLLTGCVPELESDLESEVGEEEVGREEEEEEVGQEEEMEEG